MKKRIMAILLSAVMILSLSSTAFAETVNTGNALETTALDNGDGTYSIGTDTNTAVAEVNGSGYTTLAAAIKTAKDGGTVKFLKDASDVTIPEGTNVTIDLNGKTISSANDHAITNNGTLTVTDNSSDSSGTVDGGSTSGKGALYNAPGATATLNGGTFTGSKWYVIKNLGAMAIDGAAVKQEDIGSSAIDNGYYGNLDNDCNVIYPTEANVTLTVKSGSVTGGMNAVKNDDFGTLNISGGSFYTNASNGATILNWNVATITGGTFKADESTPAVVSNGNCGDAYVGQLTITSGDFTGGVTLFGQPVGTTGTATATITGGTFRGQLLKPSNMEFSIAGGTYSVEVPEEYCADGFAPKANGDGTYGVHTHSAVKTEAKEATCTEAGNTAYWYCSDCGKYFSDEALTKEIVLADTVIPATSHAYGTEWKSDDTNHWHECTACGEKADAASHTFQWIIDKNATATEAGSKHEECSVCGYKKAAVEIPATGTSVGNQTGGNTGSKTADKPISNVPQTGDTSNLALWIVLMAVSIGGLGTLFLFSRKRICHGKRMK